MEKQLENQPITVPVLFLIFNRPDTTATVFEQIKSVRPAKLYIAADGPRPNKPEDKINCEKAREVINKIDWPCEIKTLYRNENLGCKKAVSSAIDWFFENEEMGMIVEDDCLPDESFFTFCQELLIKYKDDSRVMHISGSNFQENWKRDSDYSYYFSIYGHIWGWATWRRAWRHYDVNLQSLPEIKKKKYLKGKMTNNIEVMDKLKKLGKIYDNKLDTWDYQWEYTLLTQNGLSVIPNVNLVENIGFGENATHTTNAKDRGAKRKFNTIEFPLKHPPFLIQDRVSDKRFYFRLLKDKVISKVLKYLP